MASPTPGVTAHSFDIEFVTHRINGQAVEFALNRLATDAYTNNLRVHPVGFIFFDYIMRCKQNIDRPLKVVDLGANVGALSLHLGAAGCRVLAIEALSSNFILLAQACLANRLSNVTPVHAAAYDKPSIVSMRGNSAWGGINVVSAEGPQVYADTLANLMRLHRFTDADIVKIDIEGAELAALTGFERIIVQNDNLDIIYESNSHTCNIFGCTTQDLMRRLEKLGFCCYIMRNGTLLPRKSTDFQECILEDILATRKPVGDLEASMVLTAVQGAEILLALEQQAFSGNLHARQHVAREAHNVPAGIASDPRWVRILNRLRNDEDPSVRRILQKPNFG
jgi:FkbM family methyltransferase